MKRTGAPLPRHHFFIDTAALSSGAVRFSEAQQHQIVRVLRLSTGERVVVLDGAGRQLVAELTVEGRQVHGAIVGESERCSEPSLGVIVYQALVRPEHLAWLLQKGTEIGVRGFVPLRTARSQHGGGSSVGREERLRAIVREAAEQSRRLLVPELGAVRTLGEAVAEICAAAEREPATLGVLLWEGDGAGRFLETLRSRVMPRSTVHLLVGPEGGWAPEEVACALEGGLEMLSLGPRLLRAETAALVAATGLLSLVGDVL